MPETMVEGKGKPAASSTSTEPAARAEDKTKRKPPAPYVESNAKLIGVTREKVEEDFIQYLRTNPMRRPTPLTEEQLEMFPWLPEATKEADASLNETVDLFEYILKEHDEKGYALVGVERFDDGTKSFFVSPRKKPHRGLGFARWGMG
jgi:hypothetical protein